MNGQKAAVSIAAAAQNRITKTTRAFPGFFIF
jgi:hypothetical protein